MKDFFHVRCDGLALCNDGNGCGSGINSETKSTVNSSITRGFKLRMDTVVDKTY